MKKLIPFLVCCFIWLQNSHAQTTYTLDSTVLTSRTVIDSIDIPWEITWGPDNYIWMTERFGRVSRVNPSTGQQQVILDLSAQVYEDSEAGLLGMALHPDFTNRPYVYLVYTYVSGASILERLVRYSYNGSTLVSPSILLDNIEGNSTHVGSRLMFLPDSTLIMTTGDAQNQSLPQNTTAINGKLLRMNFDGTVPADNPKAGSLIWSWGHRNTQGICLAPNGVFYASEHGPTSDDELQIIKKARNYGWPTVTGYCNTPPEIQFCSDSNVVTPIADWTPTIAPSDIRWYSHPSIPEFDGKLLMTVLKDKKLIAFGFNALGDTVLQESHYLTNDFGRLRDICVSPDGKIYLATNGASWSNTDPFTHSIVELRNASYVPSSVASVEEAAVKVWPNPLVGGQDLQVQLPNGQTAMLKIFDLLGRELFGQQISGSATANLSLPAAVYLYRVELENGKVVVGKLMIK